MEKTFNVNGGGPGEWSLGKVVLFLLDACKTGSYWHVTVRVEANTDGQGVSLLADTKPESNALAIVGRYNANCGTALCDIVRRRVSELIFDYSLGSSRQIIGKWSFEFTPDPAPERVKWPWPDVRRVRVLKQGHMCAPDCRIVEIFAEFAWGFWHICDKDKLGTWPANESRIATNDNGYVKLSEVPNGE